MIKNIDFIIYYEHVSREWNSVSSLKKELNKLGMRGIILPKHFYKYIGIVFYKPKIIILPYLYSKKNDQHLMFEKVYGSISVLNLHSEQLHDETTKAFQMPHDQYAADCLHLAWGDKFADALVAHGVKKELVFKTGSIRNDEAVNNTKPVVNLNNFNKKVLIPTAFSKTFVSKVYIDKLTALAVIDKDVYLNKLEVTKQVRDFFFTDIYTLATRCPSILFSFRPHPYVELIDYISVFLEVNKIKKLPDNIRVERNGSIQEEIASSDKVITWYSSTAIDAYLLKKDVIIYEPISTPEYMKIDFLSHFNSCSSVAGLITFTKDLTEMALNPKAEKYINNVYGALDGNSAARVAAIVENVLYKPEKVRVFGKKAYFVFLCKSMYIDVIKIILLKLNVLQIFKPFYKGVLGDKNIDINLSSASKKQSEYKLINSNNGYNFEKK
jgi:surface carbohydrate biosynthesis protein